MGAAVGFTPKAFDDLVADQEASWAASIGVSPVLQPGDPALALFESNAVVAVFLESLLQAVVTMARASTATGTDLDSFVQDFGLTRLPASAAEGQATFTLSSPATQQVLVPVGTIVQTSGGAIQYQVIADTTQAGYSPSLNAYVIQPNTTSINATIQALIAGTSSNVQVGLLNQLGSNLTGVSGVSNAAAITNGLDAESDVALRTRFVNFLQSLRLATQQAITSAINSVQQGLKVLLVANTTPSNTPRVGFFTAVVDQGGATLSSSLQTLLTAAIQAATAFTISFAVVAPIATIANVSLTIRVNTTQVIETTSVIETNVTNAIEALINGLNIGDTLYVSDIIDVVINSDPNVIAVEVGTPTINGANADLVVDNFHEIIPGTINIVTF